MNDAKNEIRRQYRLLAFKIFGEFGASIAIPVVVLTLIGRNLDERYGSKPLLLIISFVLAFLISALTIYRRARIFDKEYRLIRMREKEL